MWLILGEAYNHEVTVFTAEESVLYFLLFAVFIEKSMVGLLQCDCFVTDFYYRLTFHFTSSFV